MQENNNNNFNINDDIDIIMSMIKKRNDDKASAAAVKSDSQAAQSAHKPAASESLMPHSSPNPFAAVQSVAPQPPKQVKDQGSPSPVSSSAAKQPAAFVPQSQSRVQNTTPTPVEKPATAPAANKPTPVRQNSDAAKPSAQVQKSSPPAATAKPSVPAAQAANPKPATPKQAPAKQPAYSPAASTAKPAVSEAATQKSSSVQQPDSAAFTQEQKPLPIIRKSLTSTKNHVVDFDDIDPENARKRRARIRKKHVKSGTTAVMGLFKTVLYVAIVVLISALLATTIINAANDIYAFEKQDINVEITIPEGATTEEVANILKENGVIKYPAIFKFYAEREFDSSKYYDGTYKTGAVKILFQNESETPEEEPQDNYIEYLQLSQEEDEAKKILNYDRILSLVAYSSYKPRGTVRVTVPEGYTIDEIIELLTSNGVGNREKYIEAIQNYEYEYRFVKEISADPDRKYRLEGYLFPDTYEFFTDESEVSVINKMLSNFEVKFEEMYYERAEKLGMSVDDLITLASILQKEARYAQDYPLMSSVFHHRLKDNYRLESDATILYVVNDYPSESKAQQSPYNSYKTVGLVPGPISNPGIEAISAAFYPENTNYYYFFSLKNGETVYSVTYNDHTAKLERAKAEGTFAS